MPDPNPTENLPPKHDPFDAPDAEDEAESERVLEGGQDAGDGDDKEARVELGLEDDGDLS